MTKQVAKSLQNLDTSEPWLRILDNSDPCDDIAAMLLDHWSYDLFERRPRPALLEHGALRPTDLDLACFLSALADREAIIDLPTYENRRPSTKREGERVVSKDHRHGKVLGLVSNKEVFSFSVKISDLNVVFNSTPCDACEGLGVVIITDKKTSASDKAHTEKCGKCKGEKVLQAAGGEGESAGAPRNFMLVDLHGKWHDGWKKIVFSPNRKENDFLEDRQLWTGNTVHFENFIHPNRWVSFYGSWYLLTKLLVERYRAEAAFCGCEVKRLQDLGHKLPESGVGAERDWGKRKTVGESATEMVPAFEAEIDTEVPWSFGEYPNSPNGLVAARLRMNRLRYEVTPALQFHVRATELAFCNKADSFAWLPNSGRQHQAEPFPSWITGAAWEHDYKIKRTIWNRLVLGRHAPFVPGMALRYRVYEKNEKVAG